MFEKYSVKTNDENISVKISSRQVDDKIELVSVVIDFGQETIPTPVHIGWQEDMVGVLYTNIPGLGGDGAMRQRWCATTSPSRFGSGAPVLCTIGEKNENVCTFAVNDASAPLSLKFWVDDFPQKYKVQYEVVFFDGKCEPLTTYKADIRIDRRKIPYYEALSHVYPWWEENSFAIPTPPDAAFDPLYSSWYNFHQMPQAGALYKDLQIASELGFKTVIIDDGWQFEGEPDGPFYDRCGDWEVAKDKFPDFKAFVKDVHNLGMKVVLWFAVPFVGKKAKNYERFKDKTLYFRDDRTYVLDPRYADVREEIVNTYCRFLKEYDIDGFKLDFIDSMRIRDLDRPYNENMDFVTVDEAVKALMREITEGTEKCKSDILFEYRQGYVGPAINMYGNMLRVGDCAYDSVVNRKGIVALRLLGYPVAVHSDMLYWGSNESVSLCAFQLLNCMFGVPQISVILANSTEEQKRLIRHFLRYWSENREVLMHGKFKALYPENNYAILTAEDAEKQISVLYADVPCTFDGKNADIFNNGTKDGIIFENPTELTLEAEIFDCFGTATAKCSVAPNSIMKLNVPLRGQLCVKTTEN